ncbi:MAG TPA: anthranilate synthase component I [Desulfotomaculum sp.]|nr:anthranilate synthase component I [Desulfotomaculum sp.]
MYEPSLEDYVKLSRLYSLVPVSYECPVDTETPITFFWKVAAGRPAFLLESVEGGERLARYSFIGLDPSIMYSHRGGSGWIHSNPGQDTVKKVEGNPFGALEEVISSFKTPSLTGLPRFFGGAVGYWGYDMVRWLEKLPSTTADDLGLYDCQFMIGGTVLIFDHVRHTLRVVVNSFAGDSPEKSYSAAAEKIEWIIAALHKPAVSRENRALPLLNEKESIISHLESNLTREEFIARVKKAKEYIRQGDILQVVLSQRFCLPFAGDPFQAYRHLRNINPSPYLYFLDFGEVVIAGSSPEMMIRVEGEEVETRPIAGTRPRGCTNQEDEKLSRELSMDPKERAEHVMLVDLGRNDLGRVCRAGSVSVPQFMTVEKYSHVMHLVSAVKGILAPGHSTFDALKACFPAGTVSGAPKVRAMEIIDELEPARRGPYAGAVGYIGFNGNLDSAITIRTIVFYQGHAYVQAGAGIVADSDPEKEYQETVNKARALFQTLGHTGG